MATVIAQKPSINRTTPIPLLPPFVSPTDNPCVNANFKIIPSKRFQNGKFDSFTGDPFESTNNHEENNVSVCVCVSVSVCVCVSVSVCVCLCVCVFVCMYIYYICSVSLGINIKVRGVWRSASVVHDVLSTMFNQCSVFQHLHCRMEEQY